MNKYLYTIAFCYVSMFAFTQTNDSSSNENTLSSNQPHLAVAIGASASTNGIGGNVTAAWKDILDLRLGYETMNLAFPNMNYVLGDYSFEINPTLKSGGFSAIIDWYMLKWLYLSAGMVVPNMNFNAKLMSAEPIKVGDIVYSPDEAGEMNIAIKPQNKIAPYLGIGFGRHIARSYKLSMNFELGAYHMGSYFVSLDGTKFFEANGDPANQQSINRLNETLNGISWSGIYPVIQLGVSYKIWGN